MSDWPKDLRDAIGNNYFLVKGGYEYAGREIASFDSMEVRQVAKQILDRGINSVAISCVFSPINDKQEKQAAEIVRAALPNAHVTLSSAIGRLGLLERENAAIINACLSA